MNFRPALAVVLTLACVVSSPAQNSKLPSDEKLQELLKLYPQADKNGDGVLSLEEGRAYAQQFRKNKTPAKPREFPPDKKDIVYGPHARNRFDFWFAKDASAPAPLIVFIHGGGFVGGDKSQATDTSIKAALDGGAAYMSINYRFRDTAPIQDILRDAARAIQYVRANAETFRIDPKRIASFGGSAGAGTSLWLAAHDDLADPSSSDPVLRQSSRISAAGSLSGQATYDMREWERVIFPFKPEWRQGEGEAASFYHFKSEAEMDSPEGVKVRADCSMLSLLTPDDPPVYLAVNQPDGEPTDRGHLLHHPKHAQVIEKRCKELGIPVVALYGSSGGKSSKGPSVIEFLLSHLALKATAKP